MRRSSRRIGGGLLLLAGASFASVAIVAASASATTVGLRSVPAANPKAGGMAAPNILAQGLIQTPLAQGATKLENGTSTVPFYGYLGDGPMLPAPGDLPTATHKVEASKTEPDKNTYLFLTDQKGADPAYDYGQHFLFQGHELGSTGYITRINLDADGTHRVTLLASTDGNGKALPNFDGSTWNPFANRLLFTAELGNNGGVWQATLDVPSKVEDVSGALGRGGYEGIQNDSLGNLYIVEDVGGPVGPVNKNARQPNSFVYRFVPSDPSKLTSGKLQVLQVDSLQSKQPIVFHSGKVDEDIINADQKELYSYGKTFTARWVTIHDTATDGTTPFDSNALAKAKGGTPMKRPENGVFRPGSDFTEFFLTTTGDTNANTEAGATYGGFGGLFKLALTKAGADTGTFSLFYRSDVAHTGFDNVQFLTDRQLLVAEDGGDTLHTQRNALDSLYLFDTAADYGSASTPAPIRVLAQGRDPSAVVDSGFSGKEGFQNDGDNEITGIHVSDGDPNTTGVLGAKRPHPFSHGTWRVFYTGQHGDNYTWEILPAPDFED
jgi:hypothetical protein